MRHSVMVSAAVLTALVLAGRSVSSGEAVSVPAGPEVLAMTTPLVQAATPTPAAPVESLSGVVKVSTADGKSFDVDGSIAENVQVLVDDAAADGVVLAGWGLRSHQRQHELRRENGCPNDGSWSHSEGEDPSVWVSASACGTPTARPGSSNHESGMAIDFTVGGKVIGSRETAAFRWLDANAARYGLQNLPSEPWHWSVNGK